MTNFASGQGQVNRCAVIGHPIAHSLSPLLHRTAYAQLGLRDFRYDAFDVDEHELDDFIADLEAQNRDGARWVGLSVTAPNKPGLLSHGVVDPLAQALHAGNTLIFGSPNRVYNTDVTGLVSALGARGVERVETAQLIGNGATARSSLAAFHRLGVGSVQVNARSRERAERSLGELAGFYGIELTFVDFDSPSPEPVDLLVNSVPVNLDAEAAALLVAPAKNVFELTYNFYPSNLEQAGQAAGKNTLSGMDLLVFQALDQIELMTGQRTDPRPLLDAGYKALESKK